MSLPQNLLDRIKADDPSLTMLDVNQIDFRSCADNHFTDNDAVILAEALANNTHLKKIVICGSYNARFPSRNAKISLTAAGAAALAQCNLEELDLSHNAIGDEGFIALAKNSTIKNLRVNCCNASWVGKYAFMHNSTIIDIWAVQNSGFTRLDNQAFINLFVAIYPDIPSELFAQALQGNIDAAVEVFEHFNKIDNAKFIIPNIKSDLTSNPNGFQRYIANYLEYKWSKKIEEKLLENRIKTLPPEEVAKILEKKRQQNLETNILRAVDAEDINQLAMLIPQLSQGINTPLNFGGNLLMYCVDNDKPKTAEFLLRHGALLETHEQDYTPLFTAAEQGQHAIVALLLRYGGNINGEFTFNQESALSIAAFKLVEAICELIEKLQLTATFAEYTTKWETLFEFQDAPWQYFAEHPSLMYSYVDDGINILQNLKRNYSDAMPQAFQAVENRQAIYCLLHDKVQLLNNNSLQRPLFYPEIYSSRVLLDQECAYQVTPLSNIPPENHIRLEEELNKLNETLGSIAALADTPYPEEEVDWSQFPQLLVAQYRCIHYYRNHFPDEIRQDHLQSMHLNRLAPAPAVYNMSGCVPTQHQLVRESRVIADADQVSTIFQQFSETGPVQAATGKKYENAAHKLQEEMSNDYTNFRQSVESASNPYTKILYDKKMIGYPHNATSDLPTHALRYGYGQKKIASLMQHRLLPDYNVSGKPTNRYLGKIFISLFTPLAMTQHRARNVLGQHNRGFITLKDTVAPERETSIPGGIAAENMFYEQCLECPDFSEVYSEHHASAFGLTQEAFVSYKQKFQAAASLAERQKLGNDIIQEVIKHQEKKLLRLAQDEAKRRGAHLIYRHYNGQYGLSPEPIRHSSRAPYVSQNEKELLQGTTAEKRDQDTMAQTSCQAREDSDAKRIKLTKPGSPK